MPATASILGGDYLALGPCNAYWDTATGGENLYLGKFQSLTLRFGQEKTDLTTAQDGTSPADRVQTGDYCTVEATLAQTTLQRIAAVTGGFTVNTNTSGTVIGASFASAVGLRDSSLLKQMRLVEFADGEDSTEILKTLYLWSAAPSGSAEYLYDAATQRVYQMQIQCYKNPTYLDPSGRPSYFWIGTGGTIAP